jgi:hypothetical protein
MGGLGIRALVLEDIPTDNPEGADAWKVCMWHGWRAF